MVKFVPLATVLFTTISAGCGTSPPAPHPPTGTETGAPRSPSLYVIQTPFNEAAFAPYGGSGNANLRGEVHLEMASGALVVLVPDTAYTRELLEPLESRLYSGVANFDPRYYQYRRTTTVDSNGLFFFRNIPTGNYILSLHTHDPMTMEERLVTVRDDTAETLHVVGATSPRGYETANTVQSDQLIRTQNQNRIDETLHVVGAGPPRGYETANTVQSDQLIRTQNQNRIDLGGSVNDQASVNNQSQPIPHLEVWCGYEPSDITYVCGEPEPKPELTVEVTSQLRPVEGAEVIVEDGGCGRPGRDVLLGKTDSRGVFQTTCVLGYFDSSYCRSLASRAGKSPEHVRSARVTAIAEGYRESYGQCGHVSRAVTHEYLETVQQRR